MEKTLERDSNMPPRNIPPRKDKEVLMEYEDYIETDNLMMAKLPNENGAYVAHFKISSILERPSNEFDRRALLQKNSEDIDRLAAEIKETLKSIVTSKAGTPSV